MGPQDNQVDVESLQKSGRRSGSCLNIFLTTSICVLFASMGTLAVLGVKVVKEMRSELENSRPTFNTETFEKLADIPATQPSSTFKMQNFAYLEANQSQLENRTMDWEQVNYGEGNSIGSNFVFDSEQESLKPQQSGFYFMYVEVNLTCTHNCSEGVLRLHVGNKLTCSVHLSKNQSSVSKKCWAVSLLDTEGLVTRMEVPENRLHNWKLELNNSGLGMFLID